MGEVWAIVVAGGSGSRFGDAVPKQFLELAGRSLLDWALAAAAVACDGVVAVLPAAHLEAASGLAATVVTGTVGAGTVGAGTVGAGTVGAGTVGAGTVGAATVGAGSVTGPGAGPVRFGAVAGGPSRSASVRAGLAAVPDDATVIVVHDAARPLAGPDLFERVIAAVRGGADGAVPGVPVPDTIKRVDPTGGHVVETLDRPALRAIQTPQAFSAAVLRAAHAGGADATDDAALVEAAGGRVVVVDGEPSNLKITGPDDLERAEALLTRRSL